MTSDKFLFPIIKIGYGVVMEHVPELDAWTLVPRGNANGYVCLVVGVFGQ